MNLTLATGAAPVDAPKPADTPAAPEPAAAPAPASDPPQVTSDTAGDAQKKEAASAAAP
jgi:hypothetical protein